MTRKKFLDDQHFDEHEPSINPLAKYYRVPGVHVKLPTDGAFMPAGSIEFTMNREVPVYPMRGADEMLLKSPDALMNGFAIESLLRSCVPAIKAPRLISSPDLDVLLMAIKAATNGEMVTLSPKCPKCGVENEVHRNLGALMATMQTVDAENTVRLSDEVVVYLRPHNLQNATTLGIASFEETRKIQALEAAEADQEKRSQQMSSSIARLSILNNEVMADCILRVVVPEAAVSDPVAIREFMANISKPWSDKISGALEAINNKGIDRHFDITCAACGHEFKTEIEFNPTTFFDPDSSVS
jgi:hypothetical protein